ncbi:MAG TPA: response regulator [Alphaproteobacteria bacterium]|nr:response regulator [Alphaproteobacteria bacterium]
MELRDKKVLVIDDAAPIRTFLRISLQAQGANFYEAATATNGLELCEDIKPDVVVLDLGLPDKDGLEILADIKKKGANGHFPSVVVLTVRKEQSTISRAYSLGADAYLTKPFLMEDLLELINVKLQSRAPNADPPA